MTMLAGTLGLHSPVCKRTGRCLGCIADAERFAGSLLDEKLRELGAYLQHDDREAALSLFISTTWQLAEKYDEHGGFPTLASYVGYYLKLRIADFYRTKTPGTRGGLRPTFTTIEHDGEEDLAAPVAELLRHADIDHLPSPAARLRAHRIVEALEHAGPEALDAKFTHRWVVKQIRELRHELVLDGVVVPRYIAIVAVDGTTAVEAVHGEDERSADAKLRLRVRQLQRADPDAEIVTAPNRKQLVRQLQERSVAA